MEREFLGDYKIIRKAGEGGMAAVYLACHKEVSNHRVILKELKDPRHGERFKREANSLARMNDHPNVCSIYHFFTEGDRTIIVMEFIEGATLDDIIKAEKQLAVGSTLKLASDTLKVLDFAHERHMYHRDIKPSNIMVDKRGDVKVIDFGICKDADDPDMTAVGSFCGTASYAPPEQFNLGTDVNWALADIYALGTTMYLMLTGKLPFPGSEIGEIAKAKRVSDPIKPAKLNDKISPELEDIILKAIARRPQDRFQSVGEMLEAIEKLRTVNVATAPSADETIDVAGLQLAVDSGDESGETPDESKGGGKRRLLTPIIAAVALVIAAVSIWMVSQQWGSPDEEKSDNSARVDSSAAVEGSIPGGGGDAGASDETGPIVSATGTISISVSPYADVYLDDNLIARHVQERSISADTGQRVVRLVCDSSTSPEYIDTVMALSGITANIHRIFPLPSPPEVDVQRRTGRVSIAVTPQGDVYLDDELLGKGESQYNSVVREGRHIIRVENQDATSPIIFDTIQIRAGAALPLSYEFEMPPDEGKIRVGSFPIGASVFIDGVLQDHQTPYTFTIPIGERSIRVAPPTGGQPRETTLVVEKNGSHKYIVRF